jgi:hypothetical protein
MKTFALSILVAFSAIAIGTAVVNAEPLSVHGVFGGNSYGN